MESQNIRKCRWMGPKIVCACVCRHNTCVSHMTDSSSEVPYQADDMELEHVYQCSSLHSLSLTHSLSHTHTHTHIRHTHTHTHTHTHSRVEPTVNTTLHHPPLA